MLSEDDTAPPTMRKFPALPEALLCGKRLFDGFVFSARSGAWRLGYSALAIGDLFAAAVLIDSMAMREIECCSGAATVQGNRLCAGCEKLNLNQ